MQIIYRIFTCFCVVTVSGCGNWDAVHIDHNFSNNNSATLDIKTRAIISSKAEVRTKYIKPDGTLTKEEITHINRICAEPSPDAMTAYAAQLAVEKEAFEKVSLGLAGSYQGSAAFVGMRTQTVQLLRDQLYRLCEANINGWIDKDHYEMLLTRNQRYTLALMAIENLAQAAQVPQVTLTSTSTSETFETFNETQALIKEAKAQKETIEKTPSAAQTEKQKSELTAINEKIALLEEREKNIRSLLTSGAATQGSSGGTVSRPQLNTTAIPAIEKITLELIQGGDDGYMCFNLAKNIISGKVARPTGGIEKSLYDYCSSYFKSAQGKPPGIKSGFLIYGGSLSPENQEIFNEMLKDN